MQLPIEIITGVVAGIFTAILIFGATELWKKTISPWYTALRYQGADISGSWHAKINEIKAIEQNGAETAQNQVIGVSTFSVLLKQKAHYVTGTMQFSYDGESKEFNIDYEISGEYWEGYLCLYCKSRNKRAFSQASMFMKLINNGTGLLGSFAFRNAITDQVQTVWLGIDRN
ncbi:hypothetical protein [Cellvibrio sp. UBA7671]|uniref:hypothetical protein n=1 Tax=Cellvibrio sp. UBA7671 TaxID=1946312 RepID=UPI002F356BD3